MSSSANKYGISNAGLSHQQVREKHLGKGRGAKEGRPRIWNIDRIWDIHHEIARRIVLGQDNVSIARDLGVTTTTVSNVRNSPVIKEKITVMQCARDASTVDISRQIQEFAPEALKLLKSVIEGKDDGKNASIPLRVKTAEQWLNRAGHTPVQRTASLNLYSKLDKEDLDKIKERANQLSELNGVINQ
jgi:hypothetical protein